MIRTVFMTGATGYIGSVVAEHLQASGLRVSALVRSDAAAEHVQGRGMDAVRGRLEDADVVGSAAHASDATIHLASTGDASQGEVDAQAVATFCAALSGSGKPFVYTSGCWVLGDTGEAVADEEWPPRPIELVEWRVAAERTVLDSTADGVRPIVLRPAIVYGRTGGILQSLVDRGRSRGSVRVVGDGRQIWTTVHVEDVARLYAAALSAGDAGGIFHAADAAYPARDLALAAALSGASGEVETWPIRDARARLGPYADALALSQRISARRARSVLGWRPSGPSPLQELLPGARSA